MNLALISEGLRMFRRNLRVKRHGFERTAGTDTQICQTIINSCYHKQKNYFQVSPGTDSNYPEFYARDFGMCIKSLIRLGYFSQCRNTLQYALAQYAIQKQISVLITPSGKAVNFPNKYSPDSVAYMFRSIRISKSRELVNTYRKFLNAEIEKFEKNVVDITRGIVKNKHFSGMRDYVIVKESCYDMIMACMLCDEIDKINQTMKKKILHNPLKKYALKKNLVKYYGKGGYFKNNPTDDTLTGHCNIFPYWLGIINDKKMIISSIQQLRKQQLDRPFPLKYESGSSKKKGEFIWQELVVKNWEYDGIWTFLGMPYIEVLSKIDKKRARQELNKYKKLIEEHKGFIEVYDARGMPYQSSFFSAETRMLWAAIYLDLKKRLD